MDESSQEKPVSNAKGRSFRKVFLGSAAVQPIKISAGKQMFPCKHACIRWCVVENQWVRTRKMTAKT